MDLKDATLDDIRRTRPDLFNLIVSDAITQNLAIRNSDIKNLVNPVVDRIVERLQPIEKSGMPDEIQQLRYWEDNIRMDIIEQISDGIRDLQMYLQNNLKKALSVINGSYSSDDNQLSNHQNYVNDAAPKLESIDDFLTVYPDLYDELYDVLYDEIMDLFSDKIEALKEKNGEVENTSNFKNIPNTKKNRSSPKFVIDIGAVYKEPLMSSENKDLFKKEALIGDHIIYDGRPCKVIKKRIVSDSMRLVVEYENGVQDDVPNDWARYTFANNYTKGSSSLFSTPSIAAKTVKRKACVGDWVKRTSDGEVGRVVEIKKIGSFERLIYELKDGTRSGVYNSKNLYVVIDSLK